jgi:hypothetical protein
MFLFLRRIALTGLLFSTAALGGSAEFQVHDGDTVVFYGDSITNQRLYTVFTEAYVLTRFPHIHVNFVHSGSSGDRVHAENTAVDSVARRRTYLDADR